MFRKNVLFLRTILQRRDESFFLNAGHWETSPLQNYKDSTLKTIKQQIYISEKFVLWREEQWHSALKGESPEIQSVCYFSFNVKKPDEFLLDINKCNTNYLQNPFLFLHGDNTLVDPLFFVY